MSQIKETKKFSRRTFLRMSAIVGTGLVASACGGGAAPESAPAADTSAEEPADAPAAEKRTAMVTIVSPDQLKVEHFRKRAEEFIDMHSELDLTIEVPDPTPDVQQTLLNSLAAGEKIADSSDFNVNFTWPQALIGGFYEENFVNLTDQTEELVPTAINWAPGIVEGQIWGLPDILASSVFYYRQDIFEEVGLEPNFETWDDVIEIGLQMKEEKNAFILPIDISGYNHFQPLALMAGGGLFDQEGQTILDSPESISTLQLMHDLATVHEIAFITNEFYGAGTYQAYREDQIVGAFMPTWYGTFQIPGNLPEHKGKWKVTSAPKFSPDGYATAQRGGGIYPVLKGPDQDIVYEFLHYSLLEVESVVKRALEVNYYPHVLSAYEDSRITELTHEYLEQQLAPLYGEIIQNAAPFYVSPYMQEAQDILARDVIAQAVSGEKTPEDALTDAANQVRQIAGQ